jgi:hypothetical protein
MTTSRPLRRILLAYDRLQAALEDADPTHSSLDHYRADLREAIEDGRMAVHSAEPKDSHD